MHGFASGILMKSLKNLKRGGEAVDLRRRWWIFKMLFITAS
jgi:hypothetical protein